MKGDLGKSRRLPREERRADRGCPNGALGTDARERAPDAPARELLHRGGRYWELARYTPLVFGAPPGKEAVRVFLRLSFFSAHDPVEILSSCWIKHYRG